MVHFEKWKIILCALVVVFGFAYALPNIINVDKLPSFMPQDKVSLGLDLQGGSHLLVEVDTNIVFKERFESMEDGIRSEFRAEKIGYTGLNAGMESLKFKLRDLEDREDAYSIAKTIEEDLEINIEDNGEFTISFLPQGVTKIKNQVIAQSMEIIRRRIDETGTKEPVIQQQGLNRVVVQLPGVENPEEVKRLIGKTAKMSFHMVDDAASNTGKTSPSSKKLPLAEDNTQTITIKKRSLLTGDMLVNSQPSFQDGRPVVSFKFNAVGAKRFCDVTRKNVGRPFAIVLDSEVISYPNINDAICGGAGIISGGFSVEEANDLSLLLRAGALPAPLKFVEERTVGPSLGADSVAAGKIASLVGMALILVFMFLSYGLFGLFANVALIINMILIFALLSSLGATLTLPGIAGIVLTIGMAVDANVLVFERIKEEIRARRTPISAIDSGYSQALSTIVDASITTLIAAFLLYSFGSGPVKGFAVTLGIGIMTSMFSAIMLTRLMVVFWLKKNKPKTLSL